MGKKTDYRLAERCKKEAMKYRWNNSKHGRHVRVSEETKPPESTRGGIKYFQSTP